ncbi:LAGLIDADG family homing endonuclease [Candidatus Micrarchaeota archaeon]|nr:LAGLIDADG family homing endonuclease [Candidatus Micrarchaeota archaeon]
MNRQDLFWWAGATHADGYIYRHNGSIREIRLRVSEPSFQMLLKWQKILDVMTDKRHKIHVEQMYDPRYDRHFEQYVVRESSKPVINKIIKKFSEENINLLTFEAPSSAFGNELNTAAYLAGVIDGDGCIQVRKSYFDGRIEKLIKITSGIREPLESIQELMEKSNLQKGYITDYTNHYDLWIYLNKTLLEWCKKFLCGELSIKRKVERLKQ